MSRTEEDVTHEIEIDETPAGTYRWYLHRDGDPVAQSTGIHQEREAALIQAEKAKKTFARVEVPEPEEPYSGGSHAA